MKEVIVHPTPEIWTEIHEIPIPQPEANQIVIKVVVAGSNPKDWEHLRNLKTSLNSGDDIAGVVHELGADVQKTGEFAVGDRVAAFHPMMEKGGAYAEYAVAPAHTVFKIPHQAMLSATPGSSSSQLHNSIPSFTAARLLALELVDGNAVVRQMAAVEGSSRPSINDATMERVTFENAATIPLVITTAGITLFRRQYLPEPWSPRPSSSAPLPLIIYGASSSLGTFAIKLARASNIHPIIAIAGGSSSHLNPLLDSSKGDALIDYRTGVEAMKASVTKALNGLECFHALDAITSKGTWITVSQLLTPSTPKQPSYLSVVSGANTYDDPSIPNGINIVYTYVGSAHSGAYIPRMPNKPEDTEQVKNDPEWVYVFFRYVARMLGDGRLSAHPWQLVEGGLDGVQSGLRMLKDGKARGVKFVYRIGQE